MSAGVQASNLQPRSVLFPLQSEEKIAVMMRAMKDNQHSVDMFFLIYQAIYDFIWYLMEIHLQES